MSLFSRTLVRKSQSLLCPSTRFITARSQSTVPDSLHPVEIDLDAVSNESEADFIGVMRRLEDAIHGIVIRRAAPSWLPFRPGASYWVPPRKKEAYSAGLIELVGRLANPINDDEAMALTTTRGWPSSSYFIGDNRGSLTQPAMDNREANTAKPDDEKA